MRKMRSYWIYYCCFWCWFCSDSVRVCIVMRRWRKNKAKHVHWKFQRITSTKRFSVICTHCLRFISLLHVFDICAVAQYRHGVFFSMEFPSKYWMSMCLSGGFFPLNFAVDNSIWRRIIKMANIFFRIVWWNQLPSKCRWMVTISNFFTSIEKRKEKKWHEATTDWFQ